MRTQLRSCYELIQDGREVLTLALQDQREALDRMTRPVSPRLVDGSSRSLDGRAAA